MRSSSNTFKMYDLDRSVCSCSLCFDCPHANIWVTTTRQIGNKPANKSTRNRLLVYFVNKREKEMDPCNEQSLHSCLIFIQDNKNSITARVAIPRRVGPDTLPVHTSSPTEITG